jgi:ankyrin repeat protein
VRLADSEFDLGGPCFDAPRCNVQPESISQIVENSLRDQILEWVSPIKYESAHNKIEKTAMSGTGQWLLQHDRYIAWRHSTTSSTLWLHGSMGSGKSCLAHVVINDIRTAINTTKGDWLVFFYCDGSDAEGAGQLTKTGNILRSFVKQFSNPGKAQRVMNAVVKSYNDNHHSADLTEQQSLDLILNMVCDSVSTIFIIDGLDECPSNVQRGLVSFITEVLAKATSVMKIFISSRATIEIKDLLSDLHVVEIDTVGHNRQDIISLVSTRISEAASSPGFRRIYHKGQDTQKQAVIDKLNEHAGGMFRWVQIAIDYLHGSLTFGEMSRRLAQLEHLEGLFDIYEVVYRNLMETRDEEDRQAIKTVLVFLLYGEDSQRRSQFAGGVRYVLEACAFRARNRPDVDLYTAEDIVALCPSLITLESYTDSLNLNWSFPHFSVREFLVTRHAEDYSRLNGNAFAAQLCMDVFVKLDVEALTDSLLVAYDAIYWISHLLRVVDSAHACGGLDGVLQKDEVFRRTLNAFLLNDYCTKAFLGWTSYMQSKKMQRTRRIQWGGKEILCERLVTSPPSSIFARLLLGYQWDCGSPLRAVIDVRPIIGLRKVHRGMTTIHFATLMGNSRAINWLIDQGLNINKRDDFGRNALFFASGGRPWKSFLKELRRLTPNQPVNIDRVSMIKTLIQYGIDVNARNALGETPIFCTIRADENDTCIRAKVKLLVEQCTDPLFVSKYQGTALEMAISRNYDGSLTSTIEYLSAVTLDQGISVNAEDRIKSGKTLFHNIAQYCNEETIRLWIRHGADQHIKDSQNKSALDYVKRQRIGNTSLIGYLESVIPELRNMNAGDDLSQTPFHNVVKHSTMETVQRWIEYGADPYLLNFDGKTAIDVAKEHGRDLVVRYLEAVGSRSV